MTLVPLPSGSDVLAFLGQGAEDVGQANLHVAHITGLVRLYTRGRGFVEDVVAEALRTVIVTASARTIASPANAKRIEVGGYSEVFSTFEGWTLVELDVLHHFRKRTA